MNQSAIDKILNRHFGPEASGAKISPVSTGLFSESFFVSFGEKAYVLRIAPPDEAGFIFYEKNMMLQEEEIHRIVLDKTDIPVPRIVAADFSRNLVDRNFLIMEKMPGTVWSQATASQEKVLLQIGKHLRSLHAVTGDRYGYLGAHKPMDPQPTWADAFRVMWRKMIGDIFACGGYSQKEADYFLKLHEKHQAVFKKNIPASLLHMDIWHENILVDDQSHVTAVIDWDRALWGDAEIEFAVLDYCGISEPAFWEGYGKKRDESKEAQVRRIFYLLYEVQKYIVIQRLRRKNPPAGESYRQMALRLAKGL